MNCRERMRKRLRAWQRSIWRRGFGLFVSGALLLACAAMLISRQAFARPASAPQDVACGQSRIVLVRFLDGAPAPGVRVLLSAAPSGMGGPELYLQAACEEGAPGGVLPAPSVLPTPQAECHSIITGTLTSLTNAQGLARFEGLGEGNWRLWMEGALTHGPRTASTVPASLQGRAPYGRTREGGGFMERVDALDEEGGPEPEPVPSSAGATTVRYVLDFSANYGGWLPAIDLASADDVPPLPLAGVAPVPREAGSVDSGDKDNASDGGGRGEDVTKGASTESGAQEPVLGGSGAEVTLPQSEGQRGGVSFTAWSVAALGLLLVGVVVLIRRRRPSWQVRRQVRKR